MLAPIAKASVVNRRERKSGGLPELPKRESNVGPYRLKGRPLPNLAAAFFKHRQVPKCYARLPLRLLGAQALANQMLDALFKMKAHLVGEIVVQLAASETVGDPIHRNLLLACG